MNPLIWHGLLAFFAGILLNAAPCVLPVIPFKVQAVMRDIGHTRTQRLAAAAALWAGSLVFFLILGGAIVFLGLTWDAMFQSKIFIALLALFLLAAGVTTLMGWSVPLPQLLYGINGQRYTGAALTGLLSGILATPCGGPFLGAVLAYALTQPPLVSLMMFLSIGSGLVMPYIVLLAWPWLGRRAFKSGAWTLQVKQLLGFILIGGAIFFSQSLIAPPISRILWIAFAATLVAWTVMKMLNSQTWNQRALPMLLLAIFIGTATVRLVAAPAHELDWQPYSLDAVTQAREDRLPVMLEFTAEWCLNCKVLEKTTYTDQQVVDAALDTGIVALRVDMTQMEEKQKELLFKYGGRALPFVLLIDGKGKVQRAFTGLFGAGTLTDALGLLGQTDPNPSP